MKIYLSLFRDGRLMNRGLQRTAFTGILSAHSSKLGMTVAMGLAVGFLALSAFMPIYSSLNMAGK